MVVRRKAGGLVEVLGVLASEDLVLETRLESGSLESGSLESGSPESGSLESGQRV